MTDEICGRGLIGISPICKKPKGHKSDCRFLYPNGKLFTNPTKRISHLQVGDAIRWAKKRNNETTHYGGIIVKVERDKDTTYVGFEHQSSWAFPSEHAIEIFGMKRGNVFKTLLFLEATCNPSIKN